MTKRELKERVFYIVNNICEGFSEKQATAQILTLIREEMKGSLLTKEERDVVFDEGGSWKTVGEERIAYCQAQLHKILALFKEKGVKDGS